jgi:hypothetical protein
MSSTIEESILNYNKIIDAALGQLKVVYSNYQCTNPELLRKNYEISREIIERKKNEINDRKDYINECINNLEKCKKSMAEMEKVLEGISITSNTGRVGTLLALCKESITQSQLPMDEIEETVFNFPYDEKNEIQKYRESIENINIKERDNSTGGKNMFSKRNNTKRRKYIAKNRNNKSKKRGK